MSRYVVGKGRTLYRSGQKCGAGRPVPPEILTAWGKAGIERALESGMIVDTNPPAKARPKEKAENESAGSG